MDNLAPVRAFFKELITPIVTDAVKQALPSADESGASRAEAVIFAEEFGLTAKDMNRSFIIPSRSGIHRNLSLSGDTPKYKKTLYPIWKVISEYKSML